MGGDSHERARLRPPSLDLTGFGVRPGGDGGDRQ